MPVLRFKTERLVRLTGLTIGELQEALFRLKCETELIEDEFEVEINPDRPDMYLGEGIGRAVLGLQGARLGWRKPRTTTTEYSLRVEPPAKRPYIAAAVIYNVNVDEDFLPELIQFQEKLHDTIGRRRKKVAIGFHDLEKLPSTSLKYTSVKTSEEMKPLEHGEKMTIGEILRTTPQGEKYGTLSLDSRDNSHPALYSGDEIIAIPPVINSDITRMEPGTRDLFVDVTGTDLQTVLKVLDIIASNLAERPGVYIGMVKVVNADDNSILHTPVLKFEKLTLKSDYVNSTLGLSLRPPDIKNALERMLYNVEMSGADLHVEVPPFRADVLGGIDLVEDIAMAIGYEELGFNRPVVTDPGKLMAETRVSRLLRDLAIGLGFTEVAQLTLTSPGLLDLTGYRERVEIANPVQLEYSVLRPSLVPTLLTVAQRNVHASKPVKVFEIGSIVIPGEPPRDEYRIGFLVMDDEVGYEDIQAVIYSILRILDIKFSVREYRHPAFIEGRTAEIIDAKGRHLGIAGEISPEVLEKMEIGYPIAVAELNLEVLAEWKFKTQNPT
ncbi:MAG: phenylalanine--tRNA ligase subunit beta [Desulfurococcales archaeon]|nr:phenylalanine--tRNA ligase subunit beta [Desulfurococcales archaeon]